LNSSELVRDRLSKRLLSLYESSLQIFEQDLEAIIAKELK